MFKYLENFPNKKSCYTFATFALLIVGCTFQESVPPEEYYARNYGEISRPSQDLIEKINETEDLQEVYDQTNPEEISETDVGMIDKEEFSGSVLDDQPEEQLPDQISDPTTGEDEPITNAGPDDPAQQGDLLDPEYPLPPDEPIQGEDGLANRPVDEQVPVITQQTPIEQPLPGGNLEDKTFNMLSKAYELRDPILFQSATASFVRTFPNSRYMLQIQEMISTFYYKDRLRTDILQGALADLSNADFTAQTDFDFLFSRLREAGIRRIIWKPYRNIANFHNNLPSDEKLGALYRTNVIPFVEDVMTPLLASAKRNDLNVLLSFPFRDHPWIKYYYFRIAEDTWFPGANQFGMAPKINLLHPDAKNYMKMLIESLGKFKVEGIVLENDFNYHFYEGFHELNLLIFEDHLAGRDLKKNAQKYNVSHQPRKYFTSNINGRYKNDFSKTYQLESVKYKQFVNWRNSHIQEMVFFIKRSIKTMNPTLKVGIRTSPELIDNKFQPIYKEGIDPGIFLAFDEDFIIFDRKPYGHVQKFEEQSYISTLEEMMKKIKGNKIVYETFNTGAYDNLRDLNNRLEEFEDNKTRLGVSGFVVSDIEKYLGTQDILSELVVNE